MDRGYNDQYRRHDDIRGKQTNTGAEEEVVEFHSEMPQVPDDSVEFIPDEKLEDEFTEEI